MKQTIEEDIRFAKDCSGGCKKSLNAFYKRFYNVIYPICLKYSKNKMEAEDDTHDCFIKLLEKIQDYKGTGPLDGWVRRSAVNLSITQYQKRKKERLNCDVDSAYYLKDSSLEAINSIFEGEDMSKCIKDLPAGYGKIFKMRAIDGYKHDEIAKILKISIGTSKSQFARGVRELRKKMEKIGY